MKQILSQIFLLLLAVYGGFVGPGYGATFKIAGYNVENLFDLHPGGTEYPEYRPGEPMGWNKQAVDAKVANIAAVIKDLDSEIVALQEIESQKALKLLQNQLSRLGAAYPFSAIADDRPTPVKCAVLSVFPITSKTEISAGSNTRSILKVVFDIEKNPLVVYVNHWKSKSGPESRRLIYARALADDIATLDKDTDFILIGDFNSDYNEYETFKDIARLNDTRRITGINHILNTVNGARLVDEALLVSEQGQRFLYNLWLELPEPRRWSVNFFGRKNSPDNIILPESLYDASGIAYVDNSFDKFDPDYLFDNQKVFRWQRTENGKGRHLGKGYSDHLPVFATFTSAPFSFEADTQPLSAEPDGMDIFDLYHLKKETVNVRIHDGTVIFKNSDSAVIKQKNGRAVYVYKAAKELQAGGRYDLTVTRLNRYYGNVEITGIIDVKHVGSVADLQTYYLFDPAADFSDPGLRNEIIAAAKGIYENGWFHYGEDRKIRIYFPDKTLIPQDFSTITLTGVRIGYHGHPEIIVEKSNQIR